MRFNPDTKLEKVVTLYEYKTLLKTGLYVIDGGFVTASYIYTLHGVYMLQLKYGIRNTDQLWNKYKFFRVDSKTYKLTEDKTK